jgi:lipoprotein NlpI
LGGAIEDYSKLIELKPDNATVYVDRGIARRAEGDCDGAIADYSKAAELKPDYARAYQARGLAKKSNGDLEGALADYAKAIEINPKYDMAYYARGCLQYDRHAFAEALVDYRKALELNATNDYAEFRVWLIRARLGETQQATTDLEYFMIFHAHAKPKDWPYQIGRFLAGRLSEPVFLYKAQSPDKKTEAEQLCEAYFYAGTKRLLAGEKAMAIDYFQKSIFLDRKAFFEYDSAVAELKFLQGEKK